MKKFLALTLMAVFVFAGSFILSSCGSSSSDSSNNVVNGGTVPSNPAAEEALEGNWFHGTYQYDGEVYHFLNVSKSLLRTVFENSSTASLAENGSFTADGSIIRFHILIRADSGGSGFVDERVEIPYTLVGDTLTIDGKSFTRYVV